MRTNPEPCHCAFGFDTDRPITPAHTSHPVVLHLFEMQRWVPMVRHPKPIILVCQPLNLGWKLRVMVPESAGGVRPHSGNGRLLPSRCSRKASSASLSSLPARMSSSICWSHWSACRWMSHSESFQKSSSGNCSIARLMSCTVLTSEKVSALSSFFNAQPLTVTRPVPAV